MKKMDIDEAVRQPDPHFDKPMISLKAQALIEKVKARDLEHAKMKAEDDAKLLKDAEKAKNDCCKKK